ncbi:MULTISPECIES: hypothetical protein [Cyanophyceae]|uniref:Uncharacterized protein n=1 Tax=Leptolyngbya subtilissima DQ-A4 TaxID=2933933 RepID=A0ABV0K6V1_9CYAN|nr:hypothetical protein [Nodosilinea sp. FACHB-141]MBD2113817.1 hypothetical protein [Nodosilinea sp. FACHB-141]
MPLPVIINSLVCVAGTVLGALFAVASIISIANMKVPWVNLLLVAALLVPVMFVVSGVGVAIAYGRSPQPVVFGLVALPWLYGTGFVLLMLKSF